MNGDELLATVADTHGLQVEAIESRSRDVEVVLARADVCHLLRAAGWSLPAIGRRLGRDHTTVIYYLKSYAPPSWAPAASPTPPAAPEPAPPVTRCVDCGDEISDTATRCKDCHLAHARAARRLTGTWRAACQDCGAKPWAGGRRCRPCFYVHLDGRVPAGLVAA